MPRPDRHAMLEEAARQALIGGIVAALAPQDLLARDQIESALRQEIDAAGDSALIELKARLDLDRGWDYYPPDPLSRRIHHRFAERILLPGSGLVASEHLRSVRDVPVVVCANHLSYADANAVALLLHRADEAARALADRLTAIAGPKVFSSRVRRFSSLCFGTIKVPQSVGLASDEAVLPAREVARAARQVMAVARQRLALGDALLLFGEGRRSRSGAMQAMLPAVARYLEGSGIWILPAGLTGSEQLFPLDQAQARPAQVVLRLGAPIRAEALLARAAGDRRLAMDVVGLAIAGLLPPAYRGIYGDAARFVEAGRILATTCREDPGRADAT